MEKDNSINIDISNFINNAYGIDIRNNLDFKCLIVDDIYTTVHKDDPTYANELLKENKIFGLCYVNQKNQFELLIKKTDGVNMYITICHEYVHMADYYHLGLQKENPNYRTLQEDSYFRLWSEFHASFLIHQHLFLLEIDSLNPFEKFVQLKNKFMDYYSSSDRLDLQTTADLVVRLYGEYIALEEQYDEIEKYPKNFFINQKFLDLYNYLYDHRNFESIAKQHDKLRSIFKNLEFVD